MADERAPRGWYLADEVGRLSGVSSRQIGQWVRHGYIQASQSEGHSRAYSYQDVAEAMIVHWLIRDGVPRDEIRRTVRRARETWGDWPLAHAPLYTSDTGGAPRLLAQNEGHFYDIANPATGGQKWLHPDRLTEVKDRLSRGGWVIYDHPEIELIEVNPDRLSGRPSIRGRRVPAALAGQLGMSKEGRRTLRADYDLTEHEINDAVAWFEASSVYEEAA